MSYHVSNPILDPSDPTLACNDDGSSGALQLTGTVAAGTAITAYWNSMRLCLAFYYISNHLYPSSV